MALEDVLRDTNNAAMRASLTDEAALHAAMDKLRPLPDEKLWTMHTSLGLISLQGRAVYQLLRERCPESFRH